MKKISMRIVQGVDIMKKRFVSYREFWVTFFIWAVIALGCVPLIQAGSINGGALTLPATLAIAVAAIAFFLFRSYCEFRDDYLLVVNGPVMERYYYRDISGIKTTKGNWQAGQMPRVRYALFYNYMLRRYISPKDPEGFLTLFKEKCPDATID